MLYERWRQTAAARPGELALRDGASGRCWTFAQLADEAERHAAPEGLVHPQGQGPEFIFTVLAAWREKRVVWPLEPAPSLPLITPPPRHCTHLKSTSGTAGSPRLAAFTPEQLAADADNIVATMGLSADQPNLGVVSLAHSYGFSNLIMPLLLYGIPLILAPSVLPEAIRLAAANEKCLTLAAVPAMWRSWHEARAIPPNIGLAISAGAPLPLALEREIFQSCGLKVHNFYGASECGGIAYDASDTPREDNALAGTPLRDVKLSLNDDGCLRVQSRAVGETYWPQATEALGGGHFQTTDVAELCDGMVFLRGRVSDQINVAGRKLWPETVERALLAHPRVRECLVLGAPSSHAERTETVIAVVAGTATEAELKEFLLETLPAWQVPREWHFVDSLTAGSRGKISRAEWRQRLMAEPSASGQVMS
jgi:acyl-CoA synthetase (AMP-forming)/AMP-acid ligase II